MATAHQKALRQKQQAEVKRLRKLEQSVGLFTKKRTKTEFKEYRSTEQYRRETKLYKSLDSRGKVISKKESNQYTGDYITGLATTHKSNVVPVCKDQDSTIYAQMRRN